MQEDGSKALGTSDTIETVSRLIHRYGDDVRAFFRPREALIGTPAFALLLWRSQRHSWGEA